MNVATIECPRCGSVAQLAISALLIEVAGPDLVDDRLGGTVVWICGECTDLVANPIQWALLLSLVAAGALLVEEDVESDARPSHPEHPPTGPQFTSDDLIELYEACAEPEWLDRLITPVDSARSEGPR